MTDLVPTWISPRDQAVVRSYRTPEATLRSVGAVHGISHERVRQILERADEPLHRAHVTLPYRDRRWA